MYQLNLKTQVKYYVEAVFFASLALVFTIMKSSSETDLLVVNQGHVLCDFLDKLVLLLKNIFQMFSQLLLINQQLVKTLPTLMHTRIHVMLSSGTNIKGKLKLFLGK